MKTGFFVSRQNYYFTSRLVVEVVAGGVDYAGPDMLVEAYQHLGEGIEYEDPCEAVKKAIAICREWRKDDGRQDIHVAVGNTGGMGIELEPTTFKVAQHTVYAEKAGSLLLGASLLFIFGLVISSTFLRSIP